MGFLLRNWYLKVGAVALAMILYTGLVYSEAFTDDTFNGVGVSVLNQPPNSYLLSEQLGTVNVSYRKEAEADRPTDASFSATVDLSTYDMKRPGQAQALDVTVTSLETGVQVQGWDPDTVTVRVDRLAVKSDVPVVVDRGAVPDGLTIGVPKLSADSVTATGPASQLNLVDRAVARVVIQPSGIDVSAQVDLRPVGVDGQVISGVELDPSTVDVSIAVRSSQTTKTVAIRPTLTGTPAAGYQVGDVTVSPSVITIRGAPDALADIVDVATRAVSVSGATARVTAAPELDLPDGVTLLPGQDSTPSVSVQVSSPVISRTYLLGLICQGVSGGNSCLPQLTQVSVTARGTAAVLGALDPSSLTPLLNVSGLAPGTYNVSVDFTAPPAGVDVISVSPGSVSVIIEAPATPTPSPSPTPPA